MNLVLFEPDEPARPLPRTDARAQHILDVLRRRPGETFDVGLVDGPLGKATLVDLSADALTLAFAWGPPPPPLPATTVLIGLPRPQTARDVLRDATTLGATQIHFVGTGRADPNYAASTLWSSGEWRRHCLAGAAQAFDTRIPEVTWSRPLPAALAALPPGGLRLALDNYEATAALQKCHPIGDTSLVLALGCERGWGAADRDQLRAAGFTLVHLGARVLRVETAVVAALAVTRAG
jgi:16S rRNA (uracil1498-N3)-methyltransferase